MKKKNYVRVYSWNVIEALKENKEVFCVDRGIHEVLSISTLPTKSFVQMLVESEKEENYDRYEFYYIENVKESVKNDIS